MNLKALDRLVITYGMTGNRQNNTCANKYRVRTHIEHHIIERLSENGSIRVVPGISGLCHQR